MTWKGLGKQSTSSEVSWQLSGFWACLSPAVGRASSSPASSSWPAAACPSFSWGFGCLTLSSDKPEKSTDEPMADDHIALRSYIEVMYEKAECFDSRIGDYSAFLLDLQQSPHHKGCG